MRSGADDGDERRRGDEEDVAGGLAGEGACGGQDVFVNKKCFGDVEMFGMCCGLAGGAENECVRPGEGGQLHGAEEVKNVFEIEVRRESCGRDRMRKLICCENEVEREEERHRRMSCVVRRE